MGLDPTLYVGVQVFKFSGVQVGVLLNNLFYLNTYAHEHMNTYKYSTSAK
jgi:hypothetical protein